MGRRWILLSLLSFCSLAFRQVSSECSSELLENMDFPGSDITFLFSPDVNHCQQLCNQHPACLFFTFIRPDWTQDHRHFYCYLKSTPSGHPEVRTPLLGVTSGFSHKNCSEFTKPCVSHMYQNVDFFGGDYQSLFTSDMEECQRTCTRDPACQFFTFATKRYSEEKIRYKCHLKFSWTIPRIPIIVEKVGVVSGFSQKAEVMQPSNFDTTCQGELLSRTDIPGNDLESLPAVSAEQCQALCSAHPLCTYFSYSSFNCYLKKNPNAMLTTAKEDVTSGMPAHSCQLDNNWVKVSYEGVDFSGSDIRSELMDDLEKCRETCTKDPSCPFYTYVNNNYFDSNYWQRCFLKRVITMPAPPRVINLRNVVSGFSLKNCA